SHRELLRGERGTCLRMQTRARDTVETRGHGLNHGSPSHDPRTATVCPGGGDARYRRLAGRGSVRGATRALLLRRIRWFPDGARRARDLRSRCALAIARGGRARARPGVRRGARAPRRSVRRFPGCALDLSSYNDGGALLPPLRLCAPRSCCRAALNPAHERVREPVSRELRVHGQTAINRNGCWRTPKSTSRSRRGGNPSASIT